MLAVFEIQNLFMLLASLLVFVVQAWAFVDAVSHRPEAFVAADKLTKPTWLIILGVALGRAHADLEPGELPEPDRRRRRHRLHRRRTPRAARRHGPRLTPDDVVRGRLVTRARGTSCPYALNVSPESSIEGALWPSRTIHGSSAPSAYDPGRTHGDIRLVLAITAVLDVMVIVVAVILAWDLRLAFDIFSMSPLRLRPADLAVRPVGDRHLDGRPGRARAPTRPRNFGAGPDEYRTVAFASFITVGLVAMACYLLQLPLSRGFLLLTFVIGTPLLLLERFTLRKIVHGMRRRGRLLHRVIAVGGPSGIGEVVDSLNRAQYVGYHVVGACVPDGIAVEPERFPVPVLGSVADTRRLCSELGADTVLVARGGYGTSHELRRIAWDLEGSAIELVVVPSLTDVAGPRIHMRPVAGLPLLHLEQPQAGEAGGLSKRAFDVAFSLLALLVLSPAARWSSASS